MLTVFKSEQQRGAVDVDAIPNWTVRYCVASPSFKTTYFEKVNGTVPPEAVVAVTRPGGDITDTFDCELDIAAPGGKESRFRAQFFYNRYNIFCLLMPKFK